MKKFLKIRFLLLLFLSLVFVGLLISRVGVFGKSGSEPESAGGGGGGGGGGSSSASFDGNPILLWNSRKNSYDISGLRAVKASDVGSWNFVDLLDSGSLVRVTDSDFLFCVSTDLSSGVNAKSQGETKEPLTPGGLTYISGAYSFGNVYGPGFEVDEGSAIGISFVLDPTSSAEFFASSIFHWYGDEDEATTYVPLFRVAEGGFFFDEFHSYNLTDYYPSLSDLERLVQYDHFTETGRLGAQRIFILVSSIDNTLSVYANEQLIGSVSLSAYGGNGYALADVPSLLYICFSDEAGFSSFVQYVTFYL